MQRRLAAGSRWPARDDVAADHRFETAGFSWIRLGAGVACLLGIAAMLHCLTHKE